MEINQEENLYSGLHRFLGVGSYVVTKYFGWDKTWSFDRKCLEDTSKYLVNDQLFRWDCGLKQHEVKLKELLRSHTPVLIQNSFTPVNDNLILGPMGDLPSTSFPMHPTTYGPLNHRGGIRVYHIFSNQSCGDLGACPWEGVLFVPIRGVCSWKKAEVFEAP